MRLWRVLKKRHASSAFSGEGARVNGGRWNSPGRAAIYTSDSAALSAFEILVHTEDPSVLVNFVAFEIEVPEGLIFTLEQGSLPKDWRSYPAPANTRAIGDEWLATMPSLGLRVPSAVVHGWNVLLNPAHSAFPDIKIPSPTEFLFDERLIRQGPRSEQVT